MTKGLKLLSFQPLPNFAEGEIEVQTRILLWKNTQLISSSHHPAFLLSYSTISRKVCQLKKIFTT